MSITHTVNSGSAVVVAAEEADATIGVEAAANAANTLQSIEKLLKLHNVQFEEAFDTGIDTIEESE